MHIVTGHFRHSHIMGLRRTVFEVTQMASVYEQYLDDSLQYKIIYAYDLHLNDFCDNAL